MKLSIAKQIVLGFLIAPLLLAGIGGLSYKYLQMINDSYSNMVNNQAAAAFHSHVIQFDAVQQMNFLNAYFIVNESQYLDGFKKTNADLNELITKVAPMLSSDQQDSIKQIQDLNQKLLAQADRVSQTIKSDPKQAQAIIRQEVLETGTSITNLSKTIVDRQESLMSEVNKTNSGLIESTKSLIVTASIISIFIALAFGIILGIRISRPLALVTRQLKNIAQGEGDLTQEIVIRSKGEFGEIAYYFNDLVKGLRSLIKQIGKHSELIAAQSIQLNDNALQTGAASQQISDTIKGVASGTEKQHQGVEDSSNFIGVISEHAIQIAGRSEQVSSMVNRTKEDALEGNRVIMNAMNQMSAIHESLSAMNQVVLQLEEKSAHIEKSIQLVTDVARRTNLIALNAGIESARAGEHGRGFAVVAGEVRILAEQSSKSAETVSELIASIRSESRRISELMEKNASEIQLGLEDVNRAGSSFHSIVGSIRDIDSEMKEVASASGEMAKELGSVATAIGSIAEVAAANAAGTQNIFVSADKQQVSMEEMTSSIQALSDLAVQLQKDIGRFKV